MEFLYIIFLAKLLACCHVIPDEDFLEIIPRFDGVLPQAYKSIIVDWERITGR